MVSGIFPGMLASTNAKENESLQLSEEAVHENMGEKRRQQSMPGFDKRRSIPGMSSRQRRSSCRRLSKSFLDACQLESDDFFSADSDCEARDFEDCESCDGSQGSVRRFASYWLFDDSESRSGSETGTIEDIYRFEDMENFGGSDCETECDELQQIYDFDLERVAAALRRGVGQEELQELIAEDMASNLESMMMLPPPLASLSEPSPLMAGDLEGRMTPPSGAGAWDATTAAVLAGRATPPQCAEGKQVAPAEELASRLADLSSKCRRRSSMTTLHGRRISQAMQCAHAEHRRSIAKAVASELANASASEPQEVLQAVKHCAMNSLRQHRLSLMQAASVLEAAGFGEEQDDEQPLPQSSQVRMQLAMVQKAVDGARRQHRQSIAMAVRNSKEERISESPLSGSSRDRVQQIIGNSLRASRPDSSARLKPISLVALMHTRASEKGAPVHCGPATKPSGKRNGKNTTRGGC